MNQVRDHPAFSQRCEKVSVGHHLALEVVVLWAECLEDAVLTIGFELEYFGGRIPPGVVSKHSDFRELLPQCIIDGGRELNGSRHCVSLLICEPTATIEPLPNSA